MSTSLSPEYVNVTLHSKRNFADVMRFRNLRWEDYPRYPGGPTVVIKTVEQ